MVRIIILLTILVIVGFNQYQTQVQTAKWDQSQWVVIYPVNGDGHEETAEYIDGLTLRTFLPVENYLNNQAQWYGVDIEDPFTLKLGPEVTTKPPVPPIDRTIPAVIWYSLKLRYYGLTNNGYDGPVPDIKIYVNYVAARANITLDHSIGLEKGKISIVNGLGLWKFAPLTNVIIAHEILHTVGASDKYDTASNLPHSPDGYGDPDKEPLLPQTRAEIMGGAIIISEIKLKLPKNLNQTTIGELTAREINWLKED